MPERYTSESGAFYLCPAENCLLDAYETLPCETDGKYLQRSWSIRHAAWDMHLR